MSRYDKSENRGLVRLISCDCEVTELGFKLSQLKAMALSFHGLTIGEWDLHLEYANPPPVYWSENWGWETSVISPKNKERIRVHFGMQEKAQLLFSLMTCEWWARLEISKPVCVWEGISTTAITSAKVSCIESKWCEFAVVDLFFLLCSAYWLTSAVMLSRCSYVNERALFVFRHPRCCAPKWAAWLRIL